MIIGGLHFPKWRPPKVHTGQAQGLIIQVDNISEDEAHQFLLLKYKKRMLMRVMKTPKTVDLAITNRCNLRCKYCYHFKGAGDVGIDLPKEEWLKFFEELKDCAVMQVIIAGGEPFFREDLRELIDGIIRNKMRFSLLSNGTLINDEIISFIASTKRCNYIQVSIDGSNAITHDSLRGKGSFQKAISGIEILRKYNINIAVRTTIHKHNVRDLEEIARFLLEDIGLPSFSTNTAAYIGSCRYESDTIQLNIEERSLAMKVILELNKKYNGRISATAGPLAAANHWLKMEQYRKEGKGNIDGRGYLVSCGAVFSKLSIRADGGIVPCNMLSHIELGKINKDNLREVWQNHPELKRLRERRDIPLSNFEFCKGCEYIFYCAGGCPAIAYTLTGNDNLPSPDICLRQFLMEGGKLPNEH